MQQIVIALGVLLSSFCIAQTPYDDGALGYGPLFLYTMDSIDGGTVLDASTNSADGTSESISVVESIIHESADSAFSFDGSSSHVVGPVTVDLTDLDFGFTVIGVARIDEAGSVLTPHEIAKAGAGFSLWCDHDGIGWRIVAEICDGSECESTYLGIEEPHSPFFFAFSYHYQTGWAFLADNDHIVVDNLSTLPESASGPWSIGSGWRGELDGVAAYPFEMYPEDLEELLTFVQEGAIFARGDVNENTVIDLGDAILIAQVLSAGGEFDCEDAADVNGDDSVDIGDVVTILAAVFEEGIVAEPTLCGHPYDGIDGTSCLEYGGCP